MSSAKGEWSTKERGCPSALASLTSGTDFRSWTNRRFRLTSSGVLSVSQNYTSSPDISPNCSVRAHGNAPATSPSG
jgi:hypothetical protein